MGRAHPPEVDSQRRWARATLTVLGVLLLTSGIIINGGWPLMIFGFAAVIAAVTFR